MISNYFPPEIGAASNRIFNLSKSLNSYFEIEVACPFPNYPTGKILGDYKGFYVEESNSGLICHRLFVYPDNSSNPIKRIISMLSFSLSIWILLFNGKGRNFDNVLIQNSPLFVSFSAIILFKFFLKKKIILNVSDLWPDSAIDMGVIKKGGITHNFLRFIEKFNYKNSDLILGQSKYILDHINKFTNCPAFLYRNLPITKSRIFEIKKNKRSCLKLFYAGLIGESQGVLNIVKYLIDLDYNFELHIYGDGSEKKELLNILRLKNSEKVIYHGSISRLELVKRIKNYDFALVPLNKNIRGAFPSKIYEYVSLGVPIIYMGAGEAKDFIEKNNLGYVLENGDNKGLETLIIKLLEITIEELNKLKNYCKKTSQEKFDFNSQLNELLLFLNKNL